MKKIFFLLIVASFTAMIFAQSSEKTIRQYGYWDNWFIQGQFGGQYTMSESQEYSSFSDKLSPTVALNIGKYFSPQVGMRAQFGGWKSKNNITGSQYDVKYLNGNIDALFNMTNIFVPYKEGRIFNLIGIFGVGYVHTFKDANVIVSSEYKPESHSLPATNSGSIRLGIQADFRLSDAWSLGVELNGNLLRDDFNGQEKWGFNNDATFNLLAGLTYRFNKRGFTIVNAVDPLLIQSLNEQNNVLRSRLEEYKTRYEKKEIVPEYQITVEQTPAKSDTTLISVIVFRTGKVVVDTDQEFNLYNVAQYMKQYPKKKVTIASYTNTEASTADINLKVSEKRTAAVFMALTEKYEIPASRLIVVNYSSKQRPFNVNNVWNKISIYTSK